MRVVGLAALTVAVAEGCVVVDGFTTGVLAVVVNLGCVALVISKLSKSSPSLTISILQTRINILYQHSKMFGFVIDNCKMLRLNLRDKFVHSLHFRNGLSGSQNKEPDYCCLIELIIIIFNNNNNNCNNNNNDCST